MTARRALGDVFQLGTSETTTATRFNMRYATGCTIVALTSTSGNVTVQESNAASGGTNQTVATLPSEYFTQNNGVWTRVTSTTYTCAAGGLLAVYFAAVNFSSGFNYIGASHSAAHFALIFTGLESRRDPPNYPDVRA
jgi:hypothetical protein